MVDRSYMVSKPPSPGPWKLFFDQQILPFAINRIGSVEAIVEVISERARRQPGLAIGVAVGSGLLLSTLLRPRRSRRPKIALAPRQTRALRHRG